MIYRIVCDGMELYGPNIEQSVLNPHLEIELNSAGSLEFTLPVVMGDKEDGTYGQMNSDQWSEPKIFKSEVEVWEGDKIIWFGRPLQITRDWNNQRKVVCEGALAYFNDSIQRTYEMKPSTKHTNRWFFSHEKDSQDHSEGLIQTHNDQVESNRQFEVRDVTVEEEEAYRKTDYNTTYDCIQNMCLATNGGYIILEKEYDQGQGEHRYISWVQNMPYGSNQPVQFGLNLLDINQDLNGADVCTVLIPTGSDDLDLGKMGYKNEDGVTHEKNSDEIYITSGTDSEGNPFTGIDTFGRVVQQKSWSEFTEGNEDGLWRKAKEWLIEKNKDIPTIECSAADLHYIEGYTDSNGAGYDFFRVGMKVTVTSGPHGIDRELIIYKLSMDLDSGVKRVTIGTPPKRELTDIIAPNSGSGATRGNGSKGSGDGGTGSGGSGGSVSIPVKDVRVKLPGETEYKTAVSKKVAKIDLSAAGKVDDVKVDGTSVVDQNRIANIEIPVKDVTLEGVSIVDENGTAALDEVGKVKDVEVNGESVLNSQGIAELSIGTLAGFNVGATSPTIKLRSYKTWAGTPEGLDEYDYHTLDPLTGTLDYFFSAEGYFERKLYWDECFDVKPVIYSPYPGSMYYRQTVTFKDGTYPLFGLTVNGTRIYKSSPNDSAYPSLNFVAGDGIKIDSNGGTLTIGANDKFNPTYEIIYNEKRYSPESEPYSSNYLYSDTQQIKESGTYLIFASYIDYLQNYRDLNVTLSGLDYHIYYNENRIVNEAKVVVIVANVVGGVSVNFAAVYSQDEMPEYHFMRCIIRLNNTNFIDSSLLYSHALYTGDHMEYTQNYSGFRSVLSLEILAGGSNGSMYHSEMYSKYIPTGSSLEEYIEEYYEFSDSDSYRNGFKVQFENSPEITETKTFGWYCDFPYTIADQKYYSFIFSFSLPVYNEHTGYITDSELSSAVNTLQTNFQAGVDDIYNACVAKGSTPASTALSDVVTAISLIPDGGLTGTYPVKWPGEEDNRTIPADTGTYYLFWAMVGWRSAYHTLDDNAQIGSVTNGTAVEITNNQGGNESSYECSEMYRLYLIVKTDPTLESTVTFSGGEWDDCCWCALNGMPTFGNFTHLRASLSENTIPLSSDYTILMVFEQTNQGGKIATNEYSNEINVPWQRIGWTVYSGVQWGQVYILSKKGISATLNIRGRFPNDFDGTKNVYLVSYASISVT